MIDAVYLEACMHFVVIEPSEDDMCESESNCHKIKVLTGRSRLL